MHSHHDPYEGALATKLFAQHWTTLDMEALQWPMTMPHTQGWLQFTRPWPFNPMEKSRLYTAVHGLEIHQKSGDIQLCLDAWSDAKPPHQKLFSGFDIQDAFERRLTAATLDLDPENPSAVEFPVHTLRVNQQSAFWKSELFYTMLMTAQLLNTLTTYQEVQSQFPYAQRSADASLHSLPPHLRQIMTDFYQSSYPDAIYRFWVIAGEIPVSETTTNQVTRLSLGETQMSVQYTQLLPNSAGGLEPQKTPIAIGGWSVYCLKLADIDSVALTNTPAILLTESRHKVFFWEAGRITTLCLSLMPQIFQQLRAAPQDANGKIAITPDNEWLLYNLVKSLTQQAQRPHFYNPAYAFALELTQHYAEFAIYFPILGRLRELSKLLVLVKYISQVQHINQDAIAELEGLVQKTKHGRLPRPSADASMRYKKIYALRSEVFSLFAIFRNNLPHLEQQWQSKWTSQLTHLKAQIGSIHIGPYDPLVKKHIKRQTNEQLAKTASVSGWLQNIATPDPLHSRQEFAIALGHQKTQYYLEELHKIFSQKVGIAPPETALKAFLEDKPTSLNQALCAHEKANFLKKIQAKYPDSTQQEIEAALSADPIPAPLKQLKKPPQTGALELAVHKRMLLDINNGTRRKVEVAHQRKPKPLTRLNPVKRMKQVPSPKLQAIQHIATTEQRRRLNIELKKQQTIATGLAHLPLGKHSDTAATANPTCAWVRAPSAAAGSSRALFAYSSIVIRPKEVRNASPLPNQGQCIQANSLFNYKRSLSHEDDIMLRPIKNHVLLRLAKYPYARLKPLFQLTEDTTHPNRDRLIHPLSATQITAIVQDMTTIVTLGFQKNWQPEDYQKALQRLYIKLRNTLIIDDHSFSSDTLAPHPPKSFS